MKRLSPLDHVKLQTPLASQIGTLTQFGLEGHSAYLKNDEFFEGNFVNGKKNGFGRTIKASGSRVMVREGDFVNDLA